MPAEGAVWLGCQESGVNLQVLLHSVKLNPVHLFLYVQLQSQWGVTENITGTEGNVVPTNSQQQDVVDDGQRRFFEDEEGDPHGQGVGYQRVGEL